MFLQLLAKHALYEKEWQRGWLNLTTDRLARNLEAARR